MKHMIQKLKTKTVEAFTLLEMLFVLIIISVLLLLFVPNLSKQKEQVKSTGNAAMVKIVESQMELYEISTGKKPTVTKLKSDGYITKEQMEAYNDYLAKGNAGAANAE